MNPKLSQIKAMIQGAIAAHKDDVKQLRKAMKACQWRLRGPNGEFVGLKSLRCAFVPESEAFVFDGRDNEEAKLRMYEITLGSLTVEIIPQVK